MADKIKVMTVRAHDVGTRTIVLDETSRVAFGLPKEAIKSGAVNQAMALDQISAAIFGYGRGL